MFVGNCSPIEACAPLAQSAERFHGKEKVDGSIPSGGSVIFPAFATSVDNPIRLVAGGYKMTVAV